MKFRIFSIACKDLDYSFIMWLPPDIKSQFRLFGGSSLAHEYVDAPVLYMQEFELQLRLLGWKECKEAGM